MKVGVGARARARVRSGASAVTATMLPSASDARLPTGAGQG